MISLCLLCFRRFKNNFDTTVHLIFLVLIILDDHAVRLPLIHYNRNRLSKENHIHRVSEMVKVSSTHMQVKMFQ